MNDKNRVFALRPLSSAVIAQRRLPTNAAEYRVAIESKSGYLSALAVVMTNKFAVEQAMENFSNWILGFSTILMGIGGLFVAARAGVGLGYIGGLGIFVFAVLFVFYLIRTTMDHKEQHD